MRLISLIFLLGTACAAAAAPLRVTSPGGLVTVDLDVSAEGVPALRAAYRGTPVMAASRLGFRFASREHYDDGFRITSHSRAARDETWAQPWGERRFVHDRHNELVVRFEGGERRFDLRVRAFDGGFGFRYEVPSVPGGEHVAIIDELTEFHVTDNPTTWWIPARGWNRYEYLYRETPLHDVDRMQTPVTMRRADGIHLAIHEAALVDYASMTLSQQRPGILKADLTPWSDGILVRATTPFATPWRTVQIADGAAGLANSNLILNLNEPNALGDVSWVAPGKYIGIWWGMHINRFTWGSGDSHGATTERTMDYMAFAARHGFDGVLVEGWNTGWDGEWFRNGAVFDFTTPYPDFDVERVAARGRELGVRLIGHHETSGHVTNYVAQMDDALDFYEALGVRQVKTGYVADGKGMVRIDEDGVAQYEWHDSQFGVNHYLESVRAAARRRISINTHEPIKDTGLRRTYPNWLSREGARGQEYNAWSQPPNPPSHTAVLPFTRMLSGPMDFTPGIFNLTFAGDDSPQRVQTTLAKQLALYVVLYSPIQMAADLPEYYEARPGAFRFIEDVPTDWEDSIALAGEVGEYAVFARRERGGDDWYLGALTGAAARRVDVPLTFLADGVRYEAQIYRDGEGAHWRDNPYAIDILSRAARAADTLTLELAAGGGAAVRFRALQAAEGENE